MHDNTISSTIVETESLTGPKLNEEDDEIDEGYEIHQIIGHRKRKAHDQHEYKIWFKGHKKSSAQWCDKSNIEAPELIKDYQQRKANQLIKS
jgi:hypothetical protein